MANLGSLYIEIEAHTKQLSAAVGEVTKFANSITAEFNKVNAGAASTATALGSVGTALTSLANTAASAADRIVDATKRIEGATAKVARTNKAVKDSGKDAAEAAKGIDTAAKSLTLFVWQAENNRRSLVALSRDLSDLSGKITVAGAKLGGEVKTITAAANWDDFRKQNWQAVKEFFGSASQAYAFLGAQWKVIRNNVAREVRDIQAVMQGATDSVKSLGLATRSVNATPMAAQFSRTVSTITTGARQLQDVTRSVTGTLNAFYKTLTLGTSVADPYANIVRSASTATQTVRALNSEMSRTQYGATGPPTPGRGFVTARGTGFTPTFAAATATASPLSVATEQRALALADALTYATRVLGALRSTFNQVARTGAESFTNLGQHIRSTMSDMTQGIAKEFNKQIELAKTRNAALYPDLKIRPGPVTPGVNLEPIIKQINTLTAQAGRLGDSLVRVRETVSDVAKSGVSLNKVFDVRDVQALQSRVFNIQKLLSSISSQVTVGANVDQLAATIPTMQQVMVELNSIRTGAERMRQALSRPMEGGVLPAVGPQLSKILQQVDTLERGIQKVSAHRAFAGLTDRLSQVGNSFTQLGAYATAAFNTVITGVQKVPNALRSMGTSLGNAISYVKELPTSISKQFETMVENVRNRFSDMATRARTFLSGIGGARAPGMAESLKSTTDAAAAMNTTMTASQRIMNSARMVITSTGRAFSWLGDVIGGLGGPLRSTTRGTNDLSQAQKALQGVVAQTGNIHTEFTRRFTHMSDELKKGQMTFFGFVKNMALAMATYRAILGTWQLFTGSIRGIITSAIEFQSEFNRITQVVEASSTQLKKMEADFRKLALTIPVPVMELLKMGRAAGQLGISAENIVAFTSTMAKLAEVSDTLKADQAALSLAKFANITKMSEGDFESLGDTIFTLSRKFPALDRDIVELGTRIAMVGTYVGLTRDQIMAWATAITSTGMKVESGGTAITHVFSDIAAAVASGGAALDTFAKVSNRTTEDFVKDFKESANKAFVEFIQGLRTVEQRGGNLINYLDELGLSNRRTRDTIIALVTSTGLLEKALAAVGEGSGKAGALQRALEQRLATAKAQLLLFKNELIDLAISIGTKFLPIITKATQGMNSFIQACRDAPEAIKAIGTALTLAAVSVAAMRLNVALQPLLVAASYRRAAQEVGQVTTVNKLANEATGLKNKLIDLFVTWRLIKEIFHPGPVGGFRAALERLMVQIGLTGARLSWLGRIFAVFKGPIGWTIALGTAFYTVVKDADTFKEKLSETWEKVKASVASMGDTLAKAFEQLTGIKWVEFVTKLAEAWNSAWAEMKLSIINFGRSALGIIGGTAEALAGLFNLIVTTAVGTANFSMGKGLPQLLEDQKEVMKALDQFKGGLKTMGREFARAVLSPEDWERSFGAAATGAHRAGDAIDEAAEAWNRGGKDIDGYTVRLMNLNERTREFYEATKEALRPAEELAFDLEALSQAKVMTHEEILGAWAYKMLEDAEKQIDKGQKLSVKAQKWYNDSLAWAIKYPTEAMKAWFDQIRDVTSGVDFRDVYEKIEEMKSRLDSMRYLGIKPKVELDAFQEMIDLSEKAANWLQFVGRLTDTELAKEGLTVAKRKEFNDKLKDTATALTKLLAAQEAYAKNQEEIDSTGRAAMEEGLKLARETAKTNAEQLASMVGAWEISLQIQRAVTREKSEQLRLEEEIVNTMVPLNETERQIIELRKVDLQTAIRAEEIRLKYAQLRADIENRITEYSLKPGREARVAELTDQLKQVDKAMGEDVAKVYELRLFRITQVYREQYLRMIDTIKEASGEVFDAMVASGKSAFTNLMDWIKSFFLTFLRKVFQNLMTTLLAPQPGQGFFQQLFEGVFPKFISPKQLGTLATVIPEAIKTGGQSGALVRVHDEEAILNREQTSLWTQWLRSLLMDERAPKTQYTYSTQDVGLLMAWKNLPRELKLAFQDTGKILALAAGDFKDLARYYLLPTGPYQYSPVRGNENAPRLVKSYQDTMNFIGQIGESPEFQVAGLAGLLYGSVPKGAWGEMGKNFAAAAQRFWADETGAMTFGGTFGLESGAKASGIERLLQQELPDQVRQALQWVLKEVPRTARIPREMNYVPLEKWPTKFKDQGLMYNFSPLHNRLDFTADLKAIGSNSLEPIIEAIKGSFQPAKQLVFNTPENEKFQIISAVSEYAADISRMSKAKARDVLDNLYKLSELNFNNLVGTTLNPNFTRTENGFRTVGEVNKLRSSIAKVLYPEGRMDEAVIDQLAEVVGTVRMGFGATIGTMRGVQRIPGRITQWWPQGTSEAQQVSREALAQWHEAMKAHVNAMKEAESGLRPGQMEVLNIPEKITDTLTKGLTEAFDYRRFTEKFDLANVVKSGSNVVPFGEARNIVEALRRFDTGRAMGVAPLAFMGGAGYFFQGNERSRPYEGAIRQAEIQHGLPENLLAKLALVESGFNPAARNRRTGAGGMFQIMPRVHPGVDIYDPMESINYAAKELGRLYEKFGDWDKALAAYNWGQWNVLSRGMDNLPKETQKFISKIKSVPLDLNAKLDESSALLTQNVGELFDWRKIVTPEEAGAGASWNAIPTEAKTVVRTLKQSGVELGSAVKDFLDIGAAGAMSILGIFGGREAIAAPSVAKLDILSTNIGVMADAIQKFEGWFPGSISYENKNPGNLKFAGQPGAIGFEAGGHATFTTYAAGRTALEEQIRAAIMGTSKIYGPTDTLYSFYGKYAERNQRQGAEFVARALGVTPTTQLGNLVGGGTGSVDLNKVRVDLASVASSVQDLASVDLSQAKVDLSGVARETNKVSQSISTMGESVDTVSSIVTAVPEELTKLLPPMKEAVGIFNTAKQTAIVAVKQTEALSTFSGTTPKTIYGAFGEFSRAVTQFGAAVQEFSMAQLPEEGGVPGVGYGGVDWKKVFRYNPPTQEPAVIGYQPYGPTGVGYGGVDWTTVFRNTPPSQSFPIFPNPPSTSWVRSVFGGMFGGGGAAAGTSGTGKKWYETFMGGLFKPENWTGEGPFGLPVGGFKNQGIGGMPGTLMTSIGMMMFANSLGKKGTGSWLQAMGGAGMASMAMGFGLIPGMGVGLFSKGLTKEGAGGWAATIGGGAMIGSYFGPIGAGIGALVGLVTKIVQLLHRSAYEKAAKETARDFGGIAIQQSDIKSFVSSLGLSEGQFEGIRKDILSSPKFLAEIAGPAAKAQGMWEPFLRSLEEVKTAWGTFDFREAFELGDALGDFTLLNQLFTDAFEHSDALVKAMPNWKDALAATGDAALTTAEKIFKPWKDFYTNLKNGVDSGKTMFDTFLETGEITNELRSAIIGLGGDISQFEAVSDIMDLQTRFEELVQVFWDTGQILPELRQMFADFGGDMSTFDKMIELKGLKDSLTFLQDVKGAIEGLTEKFSPLQDLLNGNMSDRLIKALKDAGLDPEKFKDILPLIKTMSGWDDAVSDFFTGMRYEWSDEANRYIQKRKGLIPGGLIEQNLLTYGGAAGKRAVELYGKGINVITQEMLDTVKAAADRDFQDKSVGLLQYLGEQEFALNDKISTLTKEITAGFDEVSLAIGEKLDKAKTDLLFGLGPVLLAAFQAAKSGTMIPNGSMIGGIPYYNAQGQPYMSEAFSYWLNPTEKQWYQGTAATGKITPINLPPWLSGSTAGSTSGGGYTDRTSGYPSEPPPGYPPYLEWPPVGSGVRRLQHGGLVTQTGLAWVHAGEVFSGVNGEYAGAMGGGNIIVQGPIYGWDDFVEKVRQAGLTLRRRGD